jgi:hypothetical protein
MAVEAFFERCAHGCLSPSPVSVAGDYR